MDSEKREAGSKEISDEEGEGTEYYSDQSEDCAPEKKKQKTRSDKDEEEEEDYSSSSSYCSESDESSSDYTSSSSDSSSEEEEDQKRKSHRKKIQSKATEKMRKIFGKVSRYQNLTSGAQAMRLLDAKKGDRDVQIFSHIARQMLSMKQYHGASEKLLKELVNSKTGRKKRMLLTAKPRIIRAITSFWSGITDN